MASMFVWAVYESVGGFVARRWEILAGEARPCEQSISSDALDQVRELIQKASPGLVRIPRAESDAENVVETWL